MGDRGPTFKFTDSRIMPTLTKLNSAFLKRRRDPRASASSFYDAYKKVQQDQKDLRRDDGGFLSYKFPNHLNFVSLENIRNYDTLASFDLITVTDGPLLLIDFFIRFLRPGNALSTCLLIPRRLHQWVPEFWADNTLYYEVVPKVYGVGQKDDPIKEKFFFTFDDAGLVPEEKAVEGFLDLKRTHTQDAPIFVHVHQCQRTIVPSGQKRPYSHVRALLQHMTPLDQFIDFPSVFKITNPENTLFHFSKEIGRRSFMSEFEHKLISLGLVRLVPLELSSNTPNSSITVSAHHQVNIFDLPPEKNQDLWNDIQRDVNRLGVIDSVIGSDLALVLVRDMGLEISAKKLQNKRPDAPEPLLKGETLADTSV